MAPNSQTAGPLGSPDGFCQPLNPFVGYPIRITIFFLSFFFLLWLLFFFFLIYFIIIIILFCLFFVCFSCFCLFCFVLFCFFFVLFFLFLSHVCPKNCENIWYPTWEARLNYPWDNYSLRLSWLQNVTLNFVFQPLPFFSKSFT